MNIIVNLLEDCFLEIDNLMKNNNSLKLGNHINESNISGDDVKKIDIISNIILKEKLEGCSDIRAIGSEEENELYYTKHKKGSYLVCYDPLDGSSNIDVNITTGTIFAVYKYENNIIKDGHNIVMSGYCLYGGALQYVIAKDNMVSMYQYLPKKNIFELLVDNIKMKKNGSIYSINESNKYKWDDIYDNIIDILIKEKYSARWVGSLVADGHRTLIKGGFFAYPGNNKNKDGKIRLLYEAYPFAYIFKLAGGFASDGEIDLLDISFPKELHQKTAIILSSDYEMTIFKLNKI